MSQPSAYLVAAAAALATFVGTSSADAGCWSCGCSAPVVVYAAPAPCGYAVRPAYIVNQGPTYTDPVPFFGPAFAPQPRVYLGDSYYRPHSNRYRAHHYRHHRYGYAQRFYGPRAYRQGYRGPAYRGYGAARRAYPYHAHRHLHWRGPVASRPHYDYRASTTRRVRGYVKGFRMGPHHGSRPAHLRQPAAMPGRPAPARQHQPQHHHDGQPLAR